MMMRLVRRVGTQHVAALFFFSLSPSFSSFLFSSFSRRAKLIAGALVLQQFLTHPHAPMGSHHGEILPPVFNKKSPLSILNYIACVHFLNISTISKRITDIRAFLF